MKAFRVDTLELRQSGAGFTKASGDMENASRRLANLLTLLANQEFANLPHIMEMLNDAADGLNKVSAELESLGQKASQISDVYDNVEQDVLNMVKSLPNFSIFNGNKIKSTAVAEQVLPHEIFSEPVIFANSGLHGEPWLIKRIDELKI